MSTKHQVEVCVRIRPLGSGTSINGSSLCRERQAAVGIAADGRLVADRNIFGFPTVVVEGSDQVVAFDAITCRLLERLHGGYSVTLLAYGQTGSGKTHTVFGPPGSLSEAALNEAAGGVPEAWGIFPRAMLQLLRRPDVGTIHASAVEVYANHAYDLLADRSPLELGNTRDTIAPKVGERRQIHGNSGGTGYPGKDKYAEAQRKKAEMRERRERAQAAQRESRRAKSGAGGARRRSSSSSSFSTVGETLLKLSTGEDVARLARQVEASRTAHGHALNARSSRSHCLVSVHLVAKGADGAVRRRKMLFVDLAGSERITKSKVEGVREKEAVGINQSLSTLGRVIKALGDGKTHVPFRDSTLTMLLKSQSSSVNTPMRQ